ncbi:MAG TPA: aldo/keto reductase [Candidatus Angelobacter sp.]|jgi:aryl-alcohol dehydrogenase-like predicted oxidoreductase
MQYRTIERLGWKISEIGYGMWGMAGWSGSDDAESMSALHRSVELGCNFFDTAWAYGSGKSERMLGNLLRQHKQMRLYAATKIPPKNSQWTGLSNIALEDVFPSQHIREYTYRSLENLGIDVIDLQQFHAWNDEWARDERWQRSVSDLKAEGVVRSFGISVNRWEPNNVLKTLESELIDCVQVVYNIFDQSPEDELLPVCKAKGIGVIARVPFDEGSLTGMLKPDTVWPEGDFRGTYFRAENLRETLTRVDALQPLVPAGSTLPDMALRFILANPVVSTTIPGMRRTRHVVKNILASDGRTLPDEVHNALRTQRWDRTAVLP